MSIALAAKIETLEKRIAELAANLLNAQEVVLDLSEGLDKTLQRIAELEATCARKPGPKPKDGANG